jgi:ADP-heptose:LPS heptosyltransferase
MRVLIIRCGALGDLVYATSVIDALKLEFGEDTTIDFVCTPGSGTLFKADPRVNHVYPLKHKKVPILFSGQKKDVIKASKQNSYDLLINFEYGKQFISLFDAVVAKKKIKAHDIKIPSSITHMVDMTKYVFKDLVHSNVYDKSFPKIIGTSKEEVKKKYELNDKYIIISPSNSHQKRNIINYRAWENESWKELITKLSDEIQVVIVGNKGEDEFFTKLMPYPSNVVDLVAKTSLVDLIGVIDGALALIATDTGTAHMASAVNTEVFALIGPTPANQTGPYQSPLNKVHIISSNQECSPCYKTDVMWNCKDNICMKEISSNQVYNTVVSAKLL